jgi:hypothetical protein
MPSGSPTSGMTSAPFAVGASSPLVAQSLVQAFAGSAPTALKQRSRFVVAVPARQVAPP